MVSRAMYIYRQNLSFRITVMASHNILDLFHSR